MKQEKNITLWNHLVARPQIITLAENNNLWLPHAENGREYLVVIIKKNVRAKIERMGKASGDRMQINHIILEENARLEYGSIQEGEGSEITVFENFMLHNGAGLKIRHATLNQARGYHNIQVEGHKNTECSIQSSFEAKSLSSQTIRIGSTFQDENGKGSIQIHGIVEENARVELEGKIRIEENAKCTEAKLNEKMLLLGDNAVCNAKPIIEIGTDNVKANHAASMTRVHAEDLFYLQSRGLDTKSSQELMKQGLLLAPFGEMEPDSKFMQYLNHYLHKTLCPMPV